MVVGDDKIHPEFTGAIRFLERTDPAVHGYHEPSALFGEPSQGAGIESISLGHPVGNIDPDVCAEFTERKEQHCGPGNAVHIIVAVYNDRLMTADGVPDS